MFPDAYQFDEPKGIGTREEVNKRDVAIVAVPTDLNAVGELDMTIVETVVDWLETPYILLKSALMPGTVDRLVEKTGKQIAVSVEFIGMGKYFSPPWKFPHQTDPSQHPMLIVGGEEHVASYCAEVLWDKMSPDIRIHLVTAKEAETVKLIENAYGALKVSWINAIRTLTDKTGLSFLRVHQAWQSDPRTDSMHLRTVGFKRGWKSHCWDKDVEALKNYAKDTGASDLEDLLGSVIRLNEYHKIIAMVSEDLGA